MTFDAAMLFLLVALASITGMHYFHRLSAAPMQVFVRSIGAGIAGALLFLRLEPLQHLVDAAIAVAFLIAIVLGFLHRALDPVDGNHAGAIAGITASAVLVVFRGDDVEAMTLASFLVVTPATLALLSLVRRSRSAERVLWIAGALIVPIAAELIRRSTAGIDDSAIMTAAVLFAPVFAMTIFLSRRGSIALELREEARLGFLDDRDAATIAHPIRRFQLSGWHNREARRHFIRVAETLAETKILQRSMTESTARLTQLEVMRLRMRLRDIENIEQASRPQSRSSTMHLDDSHE
jgi:hypothetical protein